MFRRRRASSNPPRSGISTPNTAAQLAASQAFLANRASNANLSASAAAAALRSHTKSPIPVGQIQTKRLQRRESVNSDGSAPARPGGLRRRDSGGSMTERTFREPSPSRPERPASSHGPYSLYNKDGPPPVPALPRRYASPPPAPQQPGYRPADTEPPERITSPPPRIHQGLDVALDSNPGAPARLSRAKQRLSDLDPDWEATKAANRTSINFSRPMSPQNLSPIAPLGPGECIRPNSSQSNALAEPPNGEAKGTTKSLQDTTGLPLKKKKKAIAKEIAGEGFASKSLGGSHPQGPAGPNVLPQQPQCISINTSVASVGQKAEGDITLYSPTVGEKKTKVMNAVDPQNPEQNEGFGSAYPSDTESVTSEISSTTNRPRTHMARSARALAKQPSIVREDREGEEKTERTSSGSKKRSQASLNGTLSADALKASNIFLREGQHNRSVSQASAPQSEGTQVLHSPGALRPSSLSPARAAHFSSHPTFESGDGIKHQPPSRSLSPAKSALKTSPSRGNSPAVNRSRGFPQSDFSDTASGISDDGSSSARTKRKSVRVSFEDNSVVIGRAASVDSNDSPITLSRQNKFQAKGLLDPAREKETVADKLDHDQGDTTIKPTPALPSFGSVRGLNEKIASQRPKAVAVDGIDAGKETIKGIGSSRHEVVKTTIEQDHASKGDSGLPVQRHVYEDYPPPPIVSSIESNEHSSDGEGLAKELMPPSVLNPPGGARAPSRESATPASITTEELSGDQSQTTERTGPIPLIAVMPATPGAEECLVPRSEWLGMPGEFPSTSEEQSQEHKPDASASKSAYDDPSKRAFSSAQASQTASPPFPIIMPTTVGIAEPEAKAVAAHHNSRSPHVGEVVDGLRTQIDYKPEEDSEDHGSIYSDAAEEQIEVEGDGFGSINAIVESPASSNFAATSKFPPASPTAKAFEESYQSPESPGDNGETSGRTWGAEWDRAHAHCSELPYGWRQQLGVAALPGGVEEPPISGPTTGGEDVVAKERKKAKKTALSASNIDTILPSQPKQQHRKTAARSASANVANARGGVGDPRHITASKSPLYDSERKNKASRSALRGAAQKTAVQAVSSDRKGTSQKKNRPVSAKSMVDYNTPQAIAGADNARPVSDAASVAFPAATTAQTKATKCVAKPSQNSTNPDGNDSDSSFKRLRSSAVDGGRYQMKHTMRGGGGNTGSSVSSNLPSSTTAPRSSEAQSTARRPFSSLGPNGGGIRTSMRDSIGNNKPVRMTLRNSVESSGLARTKSPSRFGFSLGPKSKPLEVRSLSNTTSNHGGRLGESSDEEDVLPTISSSRFADSSDDDEPALAPVRGIPRRIKEGDSTDLEDSSVENVQAPISGRSNSTGPTTSAPSKKPEGLALASGSLRDPSGKTTPTAGMGAGLKIKKAAEKEKRRRSFFRTLGPRRKGDLSRARKPDVDGATHHNSMLERGKGEGTLDPLILKAEERVLGLEQTEDPNLRGFGGLSEASTRPNTPKSPKLQRRNTPKKLTTANGTSWPLPQNPGSTMGSKPNNRPRTSDGAGTKSLSATPDMGNRRVTVQSAGQPTTMAPTAIVGDGKKKRFPALRKAFGLHD